MALGNSNTFIGPSQGLSVTISRSQFNSSLRALLQNFYSPAIPDSTNLQVEGSPLSASDYDGMWYRDSNTGVFYVSDSGITGTNKTINPIGGNFTRYGINWRVETDLTAAAANLSTYDIGEAFIVTQDTGGSSNNRMYIRVKDTTTFSSDFVDIGLPPPNSITTNMIIDGNVTGTKINATVFTDINANINLVQDNVASVTNSYQSNDFITYTRLNSNIDVVQSNLTSTNSYVTATYSTISNAAELASGISSGSGGAIVIASGSLSGASVNITAIANSYSYLTLQVDNASSTSSGSKYLYVRVSVDNGSTYDSTTANYKSVVTMAGGSPPGFEVSGSNSFTLSTLVDTKVSIDGSNWQTSTINLFNYNSNAHKTWTTYSMTNSGTLGFVIHNGIYINSNTITALQILCSGGTFDAGTYTLYGIK